MGAAAKLSTNAAALSASSKQKKDAKQPTNQKLLDTLNQVVAGIQNVSGTINGIGSPAGQSQAPAPAAGAGAKPPQDFTPFIIGGAILVALLLWK